MIIARRTLRFPLPQQDLKFLDTPNVLGEEPDGTLCGVCVLIRIL